MSEAWRSTPANAHRANPGDRAGHRAAWLLWGLFLALVVISQLSTEPSHGNVYCIYREAALRWQAGEALYNGNFLYLPTSAIVISPLTEVSFALGGAIWRSLNVLIFAAGIYQLLRARGAESLGCDFLIVTLPTLLLSWSAARHGQMTLAMGGFMMMSLAALAGGALWRSALLLGLAVAIKPLAILLAPVLVLLRPRIIPHVSAVLLVVVLLPFATAEPGYVVAQYFEVLPMLERHADHASERVFPQLVWMLRLSGVELSSNAQWALRLVGGITVALGCRRVREEWGLRRSLACIFTLVVGYLLLFSPCTENNTYALMAPCLGLMCLDGGSAVRSFKWCTLCVVLLLFSTSHTLRSAYPSSLLAMGKPIAALVLLANAAGLVGESVRLSRGRERGTQPNRLGRSHSRQEGDERYGPLGPDRVPIGVPRGTKG